MHVLVIFVCFSVAENTHIFTTYTVAFIVPIIFLNTRNVFEGAQWYYNHLAGSLPVVVVTEDQKVCTDYK